MASVIFLNNVNRFPQISTPHFFPLFFCIAPKSCAGGVHDRVISVVFFSYSKKLLFRALRAHCEFTQDCTNVMKTRTSLGVLLATVMTLALLPMLATFAPDGQVAGFTTAAPAAANKVWYQSVGRASSDAPCEESSTEDLATGWTQWAPSWAQWANDSVGGFVCNRRDTWAFDSVPPSDSGSVSCAAPSGVGGGHVPCG